MANLDLYNKVREVPKEAQKSFNNGRFSGTDINPNEAREKQRAFFYLLSERKLIEKVKALII